MPGDHRWSAATAPGLGVELNEALAVLSTFDEGPDLVVFYKYLLVAQGEAAYERHFNADDCLTPSQAGYAKAQLRQFQSWWSAWND